VWIYLWPFYSIPLIYVSVLNLGKGIILGIQVRVDVVVLNLKFLGQTNRLETQAGFYVWRQNSFSRKFLCFKAFNQLDENNPHYGNNLLRVR